MWLFAGELRWTIYFKNATTNFLATQIDDDIKLGVFFYKSGTSMTTRKVLVLK